MQESERLAELANRVAEEGSVRITTREFLSRFGSERRGKHIVSRIRNWMETQDIRTNPDFEGAFIDGEIKIEAVVHAAADATPVTWTIQVGLGRDAVGVSFPRAWQDATIRLRILPAANRPPESVSPTDPINRATYLMLHRDFSQLPVMEGNYTVKGVISWRSIGSTLALGGSCQRVSDCIEEAREVSIEAPLMEALRDITVHGYVLVRENNAVKGIVTATDVGHQFMQLAGPFLTIGEIEGHLRYLVSERFAIDDINSALDMDIAGVADMDFGDYCRLLENPSHWGQLNLNIDRQAFVRDLHAVREIRNDVMHFDSEGLDPEQSDVLERTAHFVRTLLRMNAI